MVISLMLILMLTLVLSGVWTGPALILSGAFGLYMSYGDLAALQVGAISWKIANSPGLAIIPLFIIMGELLAGSKAATHLFNLIVRFQKVTPAAPALATVVLGGMLSAVCGSIAAVTAICTRTAYSRLREEGLPMRQSLGLTASVGSLGIMVPPSIILIVYGTMSEQSVLALFRAVLVPSIIQITFFVILTMIIWKKTAKPTGSDTQVHKEKSPINAAWQFPIAMTVVIGGFLSGIITPVESGALGALLALLISWINGELTLQGLRIASRSAVMSTSMILLILLGSEMIAATLAIQGFTREVSLFITALSVPPFMVMIAILVMYMIAGTIFEGLALMTLTIPFVLPAIIALGYSPIWFGVLLVVCIQIAELSPPIGVNLFVAQQLTGAKVTEIWMGILPYLCMLVVLALLLIAVPQLGLMLQ